MDWYPWLVFGHIVGGFAFVLAHGASAMCAFRLRSARDPLSVRALLDLSEFSLYFAYPALLVILASGIALGFWGGYWGRLWIWVALALLIGIVIAMGTIATPHYSRVRRLARTARGPALPDELAVRLASRRPFVLAAIGSTGLVTILWLMAFKPF